MTGTDSNALTVREQAEQFLRELFADGSSYHRTDVIRLAQERGIAARTLHRVAKEIGVVMISQGRHPGIWRLPEEA